MSIGKPPRLNMRWTVGHVVPRWAWGPDCSRHLQSLAHHKLLPLQLWSWRALAAAKGHFHCSADVVPMLPSANPGHTLLLVGTIGHATGSCFWIPLPELVVLLTEGNHAWSLVVRVHDAHWNGDGNAWRQFLSNLYQDVHLQDKQQIPQLPEIVISNNNQRVKY